MLDAVDLSKIVVSNKWKINDTTCKYLCGYLDNDVIQHLCVILSQMSGYIKYFGDGAKNMSFITDDKEIYAKYNEIWNMIKKLLKLKFTVNPIRDDKYMLAKLKIFNGINIATFTDDDKYMLAKLKIFNGINITTFTDDVVPIEKNHYICIPAVDIDSVLKKIIDEDDDSEN